MLRYAIVIEKATRNYSAYFPDVAGCVATGATVDEVRRNLRTALLLHLEGMAQDGDQPPASSSIVEYIEVEEQAHSKPKSRIAAP
jgi:predicted RNase H-like HicB family nuclease